MAEAEQAGERVERRLQRSRNTPLRGEKRRRPHGRRPDRGGCPLAGRDVARRTARGRDDALLFGFEFQGNRRTDQREHKHRTGAHALRVD